MQVIVRDTGTGVLLESLVSTEATNVAAFFFKFDEFEPSLTSVGLQLATLSIQHARFSKPVRPLCVVRKFEIASRPPLSLQRD